MRNENHILEFQSAGDDLLAQEREVVAIGMSHFLDQTMQAQPLQETRYLPAGFLAQMNAQALVLQSAQVELAPRQGFDQGLVLGGRRSSSPDRSVRSPAPAR